MSRAFISTFAIFTLVACAAPQKTAIYLYPGAKVQVNAGDVCAIHENLTTDTLAIVSPDRNTWAAAHAGKDQGGRNVLMVTPCNL